MYTISCTVLTLAISVAVLNTEHSGLSKYGCLTLILDSSMQGSRRSTYLDAGPALYPSSWLMPPVFRWLLFRSMLLTTLSAVSARFQVQTGSFTLSAWCSSAHLWPEYSRSRYVAGLLQ
ncbi:hypothetical protein B0H21DRAFT_152457 [Amylocystis lapponica]|nr:hypothetical protein B0H21DRAFT_152457 [Amylocystis lapponica]